jgi:hypothetical protein
MVDVFDGLLEADGDEQTDDDGGDVDEEVFPRVRGVMRWMYVEYGSLSVSELGYSCMASIALTRRSMPGVSLPCMG